MGDCETKVVNKVKENKVKLSELQTKTPNKKKGRSIVVVDKIEMAVSGDKVSAEETEVKGSSVMETKTPTKPSKKKHKSMAVGQGKTVVSVENVLAKAIEIPQESSVIASETPSKKKSTSIAVDQKETVSGENISAEATKLKESIVLETKTPTKKRKKIRKSMAVNQEKHIASVENTLSEATEVVKDYSINQFETPNKTSKKKRKSMAVGQEKNLTPVENGSAKANHIIKESSVIQTPNKTSKNKSKSMAVLNKKTTDCENKVVNTVKENKVKLSELQTETPNKKKGRSIVVVDKKDMVVSGDTVSVEKTEVKGSSVMETKTPTKSSKKKRKSMAVGQIKTDVSVENVVAKGIEIPQESSVIASETPSKKKNTSIAVDRKETVSGENVSAEATKLKESIVLETKTPTKKRKKIRKSMSVSQEKNIAPVENTLS